MKLYQSALFIGRFQPFHKGHLYSLAKCFEIAEQVIVGIGSSQTSGTANNPWDYETRRQMVARVYPRVMIVPIPDTPTDEEWLSVVLGQVGKFDVVVSNNDWVLSIMRAAGYPTFESGLYNRDELEGVKIRELMRKGDAAWRRRVPEKVIAVLAETT